MISRWQNDRFTPFLWYQSKKRTKKVASKNYFKGSSDYFKGSSSCEVKRDMYCFRGILEVLFLYVNLRFSREMTKKNLNLFR